MRQVKSSDEIAAIQSLHAPAHFLGVRQLAVYFETTAEAIRELVPPPLEPAPDPLGVAWCAAIGNSSCLGSFNAGGVYLRRLERLLGLRRKHELELNRQGLRLLDRAIFAAYCACRDAGVEETARDVLRDAGVTLQPIALDRGQAEAARPFDWRSRRQAQPKA